MSDASTESQSKRVAMAEFKTFLVCALLGPPIGGCAVVLLSAVVPGASNIFTEFREDGVVAMVFGLLMTIAFVAPLSFIFGGIQGVISGIAMASYGAARGMPPLWFALLLGAALFLTMFLFQYVQDRDSAAILFVAHMAPAVLCWLICRRFWPVVK